MDIPVGKGSNISGISFRWSFVVVKHCNFQAFREIPIVSHVLLVCNAVTHWKFKKVTVPGRSTMWNPWISDKTNKAPNKNLPNLTQVESVPTLFAAKKTPKASKIPFIFIHLPSSSLLHSSSKKNIASKLFSLFKRAIFPAGCVNQWCMAGRVPSRLGAMEENLHVLKPGFVIPDGTSKWRLFQY